MKAYLIAWKDFSIRIKDRKGFLTLVITPLILTAILGMALNSVMGEQSFSTFRLGVYVPDDDDLSLSFQEDVLPTINFLQVERANGKKELSSWLTEDRVDVAIILPANWSEHLEQGKLHGVDILANEGYSIKISIIESILQSFSEQAISTATSLGVAVQAVTSSQQVASGDINLDAYSNQLLGTLTESTDVSWLEKTVGEQEVSSMQYYAAAMAVMFLLFNATLGAKSIQQERSTDTLFRLLATPTTIRDVLLGKFLGTLMFAIVQMAIFISATSLFFGVKWGENWLQTALIGIAYAAAVSGLSMILAAFIRNEKSIDAINGIGVQLFAILGGSMLPIYSFPESMKLIAKITPNHWALTALLDIMTGVSWSQLIIPIVVLVFIGAVSVMIGTRRLQLQEGGNL